ncbi:MAG TPA: hypothetical protein VIE41_08660 [Methylomirabilota bacterium]|jgi:hypothetical protein
MEPRGRKQDEEAPEMDERPEDMVPDDEPLEPDDDDTLGRPVQLEP